MAGLGQRALQWVREQSAERFKLVRWFQALMPRQGRFFEQIEAHGQTLVDGADALGRLLQGGADMAAYCRQIQDHEHKAENIRTDEPRVGKEYGGTLQITWAPELSKKKEKI